ncbi:hypothetical protein [Stakelama saccharophila]|uniref:Uncharacterized protein n=1 Tax=Stakelama saccharophila TaxID=3075605 RepID=A0ABZ0B5P1_9SPHN|nr:hypothetical protein [Stakelama sp. W311]WNO52624.1 hypothetical protein RPR59_09100 [Stakelama sp. W311]
MTDDDRKPHPDSPPRPDQDERSDIEQIVESRSDAVDRGEGGEEPETFTDPGLADGVGGTGGRVKNQDDDAQ